MPLGKKIKMYYDPRGQAIKTVMPDDSLQTVFFGEVSDLDNPQNYTPSPWVSFSYDANDNAQRRSSAGTGLVPTSNFNTPKSAEIDALGRTIKTTEHDAHYNGSSYVDVVMEYSYDIRGNQLTVTDPNGRKAFDYKYDYANRNLWTSHIDSGVSSINMDVMGKPIEAINAKGGETLSSYDVLNRPIRLWAKDDSAAAFSLRQYPIYGDDTSATGKTVQQTKDLNLYGETWKTYDDTGLVHTEDYDFKGNLLEKSRQVIKDSELLSVFNGPPMNWQVNPYIVDWTGLPTSILDSTLMVTTITYDALNRIMSLVYPEDVNGNRKTLTPTYNMAGVLKSVDYDGINYIKEVNYNARGQKLLTAYGNGIMTRVVYDSQTFETLRAKTEKYVYSNLSNNPTYTPQSGSTKQDFAYEYDLVGNIMKLHDRTPDCGISGSALGVDALDKLFDYDPLYRVISASGRESTNQSPTILWGTAPAVGSPNSSHAQAYTQLFEYDKLGNMMKLQQTGTNSYTRNYVYSNYANDNKLTRIEGNGSPAPVYSNFSYDVNGNMTSSDLNRSYIWDAADQLRAFSIQAGTSEPSIYAQYLYSGEQRIKKIVRTTGGDYEVTVYDGGFEYMKKVSGGTTYEKNYTHIEEAATVRTGNGTNFPGDITDDIVYNLGDNIGSINVRLSTTGSLIDREEYYPFGDTSLRTFVYKRYRYVNKQKDSESGLYYYGARYYASWTCRFISVDPLAEDYEFYTPYQYAGNKPINSIDLDGLEEKNFDYYMKNREYVDMTYANPTGGTTIMGSPRNSAYFWEEFQKTNPDALSKRNKAIIANGGAPRVDEQWVKHFKNDAEFLDPKYNWDQKRIIHHHVNQGERAIPMVDAAHKKFDAQYHKYQRATQLSEEQLKTREKNLEQSKKNAEAAKQTPTSNKDATKKKQADPKPSASTQNKNQTSKSSSSKKNTKANSGKSTRTVIKNTTNNSRNITKVVSKANIPYIDVALAAYNIITADDKYKAAAEEAKDQVIGIMATAVASVVVTSVAAPVLVGMAVTIGVSFLLNTMITGGGSPSMDDMTDKQRNDIIKTTNMLKNTVQSDNTNQVFGRNRIGY